MGRFDGRHHDENPSHKLVAILRLVSSQSLVWKISKKPYFSLDKKNWGHDRIVSPSP
jgi:hypothetical protein